MTYEPTPSQPPALYHSPNGREEREHEHGSLSRDSTVSSTHLMSPLSDLTDTVNAITDGYAPASYGDIDWSAAYPSLSSSMPGQPSLNGHQVRLDPQGQAALAGKGFEAGGARGSDGTSFGMQHYDMFNGVHNDSKRGAQALDSTEESPFAHMPTHLVQQYLLNAGALQQYQASCRLDLPQVYPSTGTTFSLPQNSGAIDTNTMSGNYSQYPRSPSPLVEMDNHDEDTVEIDDDMLDHVDSSPSPGLEGQRQQRPSRRASEGSVAGPATRKASTRRMSAHLPIEEKLLRAQATEGLSKQDKRRVQNKLAQRAFRARSKVANRNVFSRLEHLEELTEQQADRIVKMTELVSRLQKENTGLKTAKFESAMQAAAPQMQQR